MGYFGIVFLVLLSMVHFTEANKLAKPAYCQPYLVPIEVDPPNHNTRPHFVDMHRCQGECKRKTVNSPLQCECVAATTQDVTVQVVSLDGLVSKTFKNHTSCKSQCKADYKNQCITDGHRWTELTCTCDCPTPPSGSCPQKQTWNPGTCQCECTNMPTSCQNGMFWNKSSCGCQCSVKQFARCSQQGRVTDMRTCRCKSRPPVTGSVGKTQTNESETKLVVSIVAIGLLLGMLFIIDLVLMCSKKGFMYGLMTKCQEKKGNQEFINETEAETGSITMESDQSRPVMNGNYPHRHHYVAQESVTNV